MINAKELRIDNWIYRDASTRCGTDKISMQVNEINLVSLTGKPVINGWEEEEFEPIPINPEILEMCGFKKENENLFIVPIKVDYNSNSRLYIVNNDSQYIVGVQKTFEPNPVCIKNNIKEDLNPSMVISSIIENLHQLQNLYFALTGEELEIKL